MISRAQLRSTNHDILRQIVAVGDDGITAARLGAHLFPHISSGRSRSSTAAQNAWILVQMGLVERKLVKRELYKYYPTTEGREFIKLLEIRS